MYRWKVVFASGAYTIIHADTYAAAYRVAQQHYRGMQFEVYYTEE